MAKDSSPESLSNLSPASPRPILVSRRSSVDTADSLNSPRSVRSDRNGNEIIAHSKEHSISFADEIPDVFGDPQLLETVIPVECYKDLNRSLSFEPRDTEFPGKHQSCMGGFQELLHLLFCTSDRSDEDMPAFRSESYYM